MAMQVIPQSIGVDVAKDTLSISIDGQEPFEVANNRQALKQWLRSLKGTAEIAIEATNNYHLMFADLAHALGHRIFMINGLRLNRYRESVGGRAKNDRADALLLVRYLKNERQDLVPWEPPSREYRQIMDLLRRRASLVQAKASLVQSFSELALLQASLKALVKQISRLEALIEKHILQLLRDSPWHADVQRCMAVEGIGFLTATALTTAFHRGAFRSSDAFIAFLGLDVRVRDSGKMKGRRKLTKQGDAETRRLLYMAAMAAKRMKGWKEIYQRYIDRGMASTQALNALARKLARIAFSLMRNQSIYASKFA